MWNGQDPAWYSGDDAVDIFSHDIYCGIDNKTYGSQLPTYQQALGAPKKPSRWR